MSLRGALMLQPAGPTGERDGAFIDSEADDCKKTPVSNTGVNSGRGYRGAASVL
jgi:hypothetical protein